MLVVYSFVTRACDIPARSNIVRMSSCALNSHSHDGGGSDSTSRSTTRRVMDIGEVGVYAVYQDDEAKRCLKSGDNAFR